MKLIQTPSLITGVILGASLITLSAASNDSALGGLHVFVPGTTVSSADVNDNFTMVVDEVSALEGRMDNLEGSSSQTEIVDFFHPVLLPGENASNLSVTVPQGYTYRMLEGQVVYDVSGNGNTGALYSLKDTPLVAGNWEEQVVMIKYTGMAQVTMSCKSVDSFDIVFLPGTTITFEVASDGAPPSPWLWTNLYVQIEKSSSNI